MMGDCVVVWIQDAVLGRREKGEEVLRSSGLLKKIVRLERTTVRRELPTALSAVRLIWIGREVDGGAAKDLAPYSDLCASRATAVYTRDKGLLYCTRSAGCLDVRVQRCEHWDQPLKLARTRTMDTLAAAFALQQEIIYREAPQQDTATRV